MRVFALWSGARRLEDRAAVLARVKANPRQAGLDAGGMLVSGGVKMFMDGSGGARTAWMYDDWNKNLNEVDKGNKGYPVDRPRRVSADRHRAAQRRRAREHARHRRSRHRLGGRHLRPGAAATADARPAPRLRFTPTRRPIAPSTTMARLQRDHDAGYPEASAGFMWWIGDNYAGNLGPQRNLRLKPFQTFVRKGVQWAGGSDYPVTPFPARYGLWASVARETLNGTYGATPFGTERGRGRSRRRCGRTRRGRRARCFWTIASARSRPARTPTLRCGIAIRTQVPTDRRSRTCAAS